MMTATPADLMKYSTLVDLNARGRRLTDLIPMAFARFVASDPVETIAKAERREAARQAVDNLLLC